MPAMRYELRCSRSRTWLVHHDWLSRLHPLRIAYAHDCNVGHRRVLCERRLDLPTINILTARNDHVLLAIDEKYISFLVGHADVARVEPAVPDTLERRNRVIPISIEHDL